MQNLSFGRQYSAKRRTNDFSFLQHLSVSVFGHGNKNWFSSSSRKTCGDSSKSDLRKTKLSANSLTSSFFSLNFCSDERFSFFSRYFNKTKPINKTDKVLRKLFVAARKANFSFPLEMNRIGTIFRSVNKLELFHRRNIGSVALAEDVFRPNDPTGDPERCLIIAFVSKRKTNFLFSKIFSLRFQVMVCSDFGVTGDRWPKQFVKSRKFRFLS